MYVEIDSLSMIYELKKDEIILDPIKSEKFRVNQINDGHLILCAENEKSPLRVIAFTSFLKEKWKVEIAKIAR